MKLITALLVIFMPGGLVLLFLYLVFILSDKESRRKVFARKKRSSKGFKARWADRMSKVWK